MHIRTRAHTCAHTDTKVNVSAREKLKSHLNHLNKINALIFQRKLQPGEVKEITHCGPGVVLLALPSGQVGFY